jgi:hypothetical protein
MKSSRSNSMLTVSSLTVSRLIVSAVLLAVILLGSMQRVSAQPTGRAAFVKADRSKIFFYDGTKLDSTAIFAPGIPLTGVSNLAVLGSTRNGKSLLVGGRFRFPNPTNFLPDSAFAIIRLDSPFVFTAPQLPLLKSSILKIIYLNSVRPLPLAVITDDEKQWYATWVSSAPGAPEFWLYHGNMDGTGTVDSVSIPNNNSHLQSDYHMSNLATTPDGGQMYCVIVDRLSNAISFPRYQLVKFEPHPSGASSVFGIKEFTSAVKPLFNSGNPDSSFGFAMRIVPNSNPLMGQMIMSSNDNNDLSLVSFRADVGAPIALTAGTQIPRSILPDTVDFFAGYGGDVIATSSQRGNGGDMMFIGRSDSLIFTTHEREDDIHKRGVCSGVWLYDMNGGGSAQLIYNDPNKQEVQPIWVPTPPVVIPPVKPGYVTLGTQSLDFGTHDFTKDTILHITVTNTSSKNVMLDDVTISGTDATDFTIAGSSKGGSKPWALAVGDSNVFSIAFTATSPARTEHATLTAYFAGSPDSTRTATLTGVSHKPTGGYVQPTAEQMLSLTVSPNPTHSSTVVAYTARVTASAQIEIRDVLGRMIYATTPEKLGAGESRQFHFDAKALKLSDGVYYLTAKIGGDHFTREIVVAK